MRKDHIILGGKKYRVEINWNTITEYLKETGKDDFGELSNITFNPSEVATYLRCAIAEGEDIEGREFTMTTRQVGRLMNNDVVVEFMKIYADHVTAATAGTEVEGDESSKKNN